MMDSSQVSTQVFRQIYKVFVTLCNQDILKSSKQVKVPLTILLLSFEP